MAQITTYHSCGEYSYHRGLDEHGKEIPIVYALPAWAYRGWVIPGMKCQNCEQEGVQLRSAKGKTLRSLDELPCFTIKVGNTKHGKFYQSYIAQKDWEYWCLDLLQCKLLHILANRATDGRKVQPIVWVGQLGTNNRIYVPADKFEPGEIIHVGLLF